MKKLDLSIILKAIDKASGPIRKVESALGRMAGSAKLAKVGVAADQVGERVGRVADHVGRLGAQVGLLGAGATWLFKSQLIDTAAEFERFTAILETVEGSSAKARRSMNWVSNFAAQTPYELAEVTDAFVSLKSYGLDPMNGLLKTLGDTSAAMGKPLSQAVEAMADAVTGENERLKEFGIRASVQGKKIVYEYTANGKTMRKTARADSREQIQSTLQAIWNEKYAGAMEKRSKTWEGMVSNLKDQWTRFKLMIMEQGVFDWLKGKLDGALSKINQMAANGQLQVWAKDVGQKLKTGLVAAWKAGVALWQVMQGLGRVVKWVADQVGGFKNLGMILAGLMAGKLILSVVSLTGSLFTLGRVVLPVVLTGIRAVSAALLMNPIGLAVTVIAGAVFLIYKNWGTLGPWFARLLASIQTVFSASWGAIKDAFLNFAPLGLIIQNWEPLVAWFKGLAARLAPIIEPIMGGVRWVGKKLGIGGGEGKAPARTVAPSAQRAPSALPKGRPEVAQAQVGGTVHIKLDQDGRARVQQIKSDNPRVGINVDAGLMTVGR